jgi:hypothetical protein
VGAAEIEHLRHFGKAADERAGKAATREDQAESGNGQRLRGRADQGDVAVAAEQVASRPSTPACPAMRSSAAPLVSAKIARRDPGEHDVHIEILFRGIRHSDLHQARDEWHARRQLRFHSRRRLRRSRHQRLRRFRISSAFRETDECSSE